MYHKIDGTPWATHWASVRIDPTAPHSKASTLPIAPHVGHSTEKPYYDVALAAAISALC